MAERVVMKTLVLKLHKADHSSFKSSGIDSFNGSETEAVEEEDCARTQPYSKRRWQCSRTHPEIALPPAKRRKSDPLEDDTKSLAKPFTLIQKLMSYSRPPSKATPSLAATSSKAQVKKTVTHQTNVRLQQLLKRRHRLQQYRISRETGAVVQRPTISNYKSRNNLVYAYGARLPLKRPTPSVSQQKRALAPTKPLMVHIRLSQLVQPCSLSVRTVGTYRTSSTQTDQVFVGDKEEARELIRCEVKESLATVGKALAYTQREVEKLKEEKERLEVLLHEKTALILGHSAHSTSSRGCVWVSCARARPFMGGLKLSNKRYRKKVQKKALKDTSKKLPNKPINNVSKKVTDKSINNVSKNVTDKSINNVSQEVSNETSKELSDEVSIELPDELIRYDYPDLHTDEMLSDRSPCDSECSNMSEGSVVRCHDVQTANASCDEPPISEGREFPEIVFDLNLPVLSQALANRPEKDEIMRNELKQFVQYLQSLYTCLKQLSSSQSNHSPVTTQIVNAIKKQLQLFTKSLKGDNLDGLTLRSTISLVESAIQGFVGTGNSKLANETNQLFSTDLINQVMQLQTHNISTHTSLPPSTHTSLPPSTAVPPSTQSVKKDTGQPGTPVSGEPLSIVSTTSGEESTSSPPMGRTASVRPSVTIKPVSEATSVRPPITVKPVSEATSVRPPITIKPASEATSVFPSVTIKPASESTSVFPSVTIKPASEATSVRPPITIKPASEATSVRQPITIKPVSEATSVRPPITVAKAMISIEPVTVATIVHPSITIKPFSEARSVRPPVTIKPFSEVRPPLTNKPASGAASVPPPPTKPASGAASVPPPLTNKPVSGAASVRPPPTNKSVRRPVTVRPLNIPASIRRNPPLSPEAQARIDSIMANYKIPKKQNPLRLSSDPLKPVGGVPPYQSNVWRLPLILARPTNPPRNSCTATEPPHQSDRVPTPPVAQPTNPPRNSCTATEPPRQSCDRGLPLVPTPPVAQPTNPPRNSCTPPHQSDRGLPLAPTPPEAQPTTPQPTTPQPTTRQPTTRLRNSDRRLAVGLLTKLRDSISGADVHMKQTLNEKIEHLLHKT